MSKILTKHLIGDSLVSYVDAPLTSVPNTTIQGRALIRNPASDMKVHGGIDRIMVQQIIEMPNEFGPNGESVYQADNKDNRLRFVESALSSKKKVETIDAYEPEWP